MLIQNLTLSGAFSQLCEFTEISSSTKSSITSQEMFSRELLPGIPNDTTLTRIATKLPWATFQILSLVSSNWQGAIGSREVYRERVRFSSSEELVVLKHYCSATCDDDLHQDCTYRNAISLYSLREKAFYQLPPIPHLRFSYEFLCQIVASDGKLYVCSHNWDLESKTKKRRKEREGDNEKMRVHVLDLAGQGKWKECTSIEDQEGESEPAIGIDCRFKGGEEHKFAVDGNPDWFNSSCQVVNSWQLPPSGALALQNNPERSFTGDPRRSEVERLKYVMKNPAIGTPEIYVQDTNTKLWTHQHSISSDEIADEIAPELGPDHPLRIEPAVVVVVDNELLTIARWSRSTKSGYELLQTIGFGTQSKFIAWRKPSHSFEVEPNMFCGMSPIML